MLGVPEGRVTLAPYHGSWPRAFEAERERIAGALGPACVAVEHVGSTAVPGIELAKPLIDAMVGLGRIADHAGLVAPMESLGYTYKGEFGIPDRHFFTLGDPTTHHVHMVEHGGAFWRLNLLFRDHLRADASARQRYVARKRELLDRFADARERYTQGKDEIIKALLAEAGWEG